MTAAISETCFCGSGRLYPACCGDFISGQSYPDTPEQLMRSRYAAYVQSDMDYIEQTMQGPAAVDFDKESSKEWASSVKWLRLKVLGVDFELGKTVGFVEFMAVYREGGGRSQKIHERSEFRLIDGRWYYWSAAVRGI